MNKFFTKVASLCVGLAMAAGVGVAVSAVKASEVKADTFNAVSSLSAGDVIYMTYSASSANWELTSVTSGTKGNVESFSGTALKGTYPLTVEVSGANYYFKDSNNKYLAYTSTATSKNNNLWLVDSSSANGAAWTVSFSGTSATIRNVYNTSRYLKGNAQSGSERICGYTTTGTLTLYSSSSTPEPEEKYSVIFHANGDGVTGMPSNLTEQYGNVSLADVAHPSRESYTFRGWSLTEDGELVTSVNVTTADVDVYAIWSYVDPDAGTPVEIVKGDGKSYDDITVNGTAGCKIGTSSATGTVTITVPASTVYLSVHIAGWKDKAVTIGVSVSSGSISPSEHSVKSDSGVTGNSPFTLSGDENDYLCTYDLTDIVEETVVTFTATENYRAVFWTANYKTESVDPSLGTLYVGQVQTGSITMNSSFTVGYSKTADIYEFRAFSVEDPALASDSIKAINWEVGDSTVVSVDVTDGAAKITTLKPGTTTLKAVHSASEKAYNDATVTLEVSKGWLEDIAITGSMTQTSYSDKQDWDPSGLVVTASYHYGWEEVVESGIDWSYNPSKPAEGVTSVVVSAHYEEGGYEADASSSAQTVSVYVAHAGTAEDPFTVAEALAECASAGSTATGPWYVQGIISYYEKFDSKYSSCYYYISDDGTRTNELYVYSGKNIGNVAFTEETAETVKAGKIAVVCGQLKTYNSVAEFDKNNYLISLETPVTDVDVTFEPASTSFEIGATGTFTATSQTSGAVFTWSVDNSGVLSVNESTGAYEALALGTARVTVTASAGGKQGTTFVDFTVNGNYYMTVDSAIEIAAGVESGKTTDYYIYVEGFVKEFATSSKDGNPRAFDISNKGENKSIMVYTNTEPYADFVNGLSLGDCVRVKAQVQNYNGKYELVNPTREYIEKTSISFAYELLSQTDAVCKDYDGVTDNTDAIEAFWDDLDTLFTGLNDAQKADLVDPSTRGCGETVLDAVARYDYLVAKYGLDNFIAGRDPHLTGVHQIANTTIESDSAMIVVVIAAVTSLTSIAVLLVIKRRKALIK